MHPNRHALSQNVRFVASFEELVSASFEADINALCWPRALAGDFQEVVDKLATGGGITTIEGADLAALSLSPEGSIARSTLLSDQALLAERGLQPALDCIRGYRRDETVGPIPTDVYSFHVDRATVAADTYLCTYAGGASEGLLNAEAIRKVDVAQTRARLLLAYGGHDDDGFVTYLSEHSYDLHYAALPGAVPYCLGLHNLWRIAIAYPGSPVPPCIQRAPLTRPGDPARLLLIS